MSNEQQADPGRPHPDPFHATESVSASAYGAADGHPAGLSVEDGSVFLADLTKAMQATADAQRLRVTESADERRQAHIDSIRGRETAQSEELRELAERDVKGIEAWATAEIERVRLERQRRISARKAELERRLEQHHNLIEREVAAVEVAVVGYRGELDRFFDQLDHESDPVAFAREAANIPPFPVLEVIGPDDAPGVVSPAPSPYTSYTSSVTSLSAVSYHIPATTPVDATPIADDPASTNGTAEAVAADHEDHDHGSDESGPTASSGGDDASAEAGEVATDIPVAVAQATDTETAAAAVIAESVATEATPSSEPFSTSVDADESLSALVETPAAIVATQIVTSDPEPAVDAVAETVEAATAEAIPDEAAEAEPVGAAAAMVAVMDPEPAEATSVAPWDRPAETSDAPAAAVAASTEDQVGPEVAAVTEVEAQPDPAYVPMSEEDLIGDSDQMGVTAGVGKIAPRSSGAVIQSSVPSLRPIGSWLRRSNHSS